MNLLELRARARATRRIHEPAHATLDHDMTSSRSPRLDLWLTVFPAGLEQIAKHEVATTLEQVTVSPNSALRASAALPPTTPRRPSRSRRACARAHGRARVRAPSAAARRSRAPRPSPRPRLRPPCCRCRARAREPRARFDAHAPLLLAADAALRFHVARRRGDAGFGTDEQHAAAAPAVSRRASGWQGAAATSGSAHEARAHADGALWIGLRLTRSRLAARPRRAAAAAARGARRAARAQRGDRERRSSRGRAARLRRRQRRRAPSCATPCAGRAASSRSSRPPSAAASR